MPEQDQWKMFGDLLYLTLSGFSLCLTGRVYQHKSLMLYGTETWAVKEADLLGLECNDMRMIRCMCNVTLKDRKPSSEMRERLGLDSIRNCIRRGRLRLFSHVCRKMQ